jgi:hypothetical protein
LAPPCTVGISPSWRMSALGWSSSSGLPELDCGAWRAALPVTFEDPARAAPSPGWPGRADRRCGVCGSTGKRDLRTTREVLEQNWGRRPVRLGEGGRSECHVIAPLEDARVPELLEPPRQRRDLLLPPSLGVLG